jgi:hypothetical protein
MSASLVRKALDETSFASDEKLDHLSKGSKKKFKPKPKKKVSSEKLLKQNLKILQALEYKRPSNSKFQKTGAAGAPSIDNESSSSATPKPNQSGRKKRKQEGGGGGGGSGGGSAFTDEDFEKFESEYFVS